MVKIPENRKKLGIVRVRGVERRERGGRGLSCHFFFASVSRALGHPPPFRRRAPCSPTFTNSVTF